MKRSVMVLFVVLISIVLVSCQGGSVKAGENPRDTEAVINLVKTGTQGLEVTLVPNYPPTTIYDQNELIALLELKNKGNHDLEAQDCFVQITGFDPNIIGGDFQRVQECNSNLAGPLEGKSVYNTEGGYNQLEFSSSTIRLPQGVYEYKPQLNFLTCYEYETTAAPVVCVDPILYQVTDEQKSCTPTDISMGNGQGGPVGVSYVGVNMVGSKAIFEITIKNFGSGRVISPNADIRNCGQTSLNYRDLDRVEFDPPVLSGGSIINCNPNDNTIRLNNGQGKIVCSYQIPQGSAFETPMTIKLRYAYVKNFVKQVNIIDTPE